MERIKEKRRNLIEKICIVLLLISISAGCLQKDIDLPATDKEPEKPVPVEDKVDREPEKTVPIEYYAEKEPLTIEPLYEIFSPKARAELNITQEERDRITVQCRKAFEENAERLAREVPTKFPENWTQGEVQLKKEKFLMGNETPSLGRVDDKVVARFHAIGHNIRGPPNVKIFKIGPVFDFYTENDCIYNIKEKKVEKIRITFWPMLHLG